MYRCIPISHYPTRGQETYKAVESTDMKRTQVYQGHTRRSLIAYLKSEGIEVISTRKVKALRAIYNRHVYTHYPHLRYPTSTATST